MSLSTLSSQLAHINNASTNKGVTGGTYGSSIPTTRKTDDVIGRGIHHSAKHGHAVISSNVKKIPSVLFENPKEASDVPLTTIRENALIALHQLHTITQDTQFLNPNYIQNLFSSRSLQFERALATPDKNDQVDTYILSLLTLLSTVFSSNEQGTGKTSYSSTSNLALHVLEYLIRRYDIHIRQNTAHALLLSIWPHYESLSNPQMTNLSFSVSNRILELINIAEISDQMWIFLRPYASSSMAPPTRSIFAKHCAKKDDLILQCCQLAQNMSKLFIRSNKNHRDIMNEQKMEADQDIVVDDEEDYKDEEDDNGNSYWMNATKTKIRPGISYVLSFTAALLVEALTLQCKEHSSVRESTLRTMLPFILTACGPDHEFTNHPPSTSFLLHLCSDFRVWGYILTTTLLEKCTLNDTTKEVMANSIVMGFNHIQSILQQSTMSIGNYRNMNGSIDVLQTAMESYGAVMMLVGQTIPTHAFLEKEKERMKQLCNTENTIVFKLLSKHGCALPFSTFQKLMKHYQVLAPSLGFLRNDRDVDITSFVCSIVSMAVILLDPDFDSNITMGNPKNIGLTLIETFSKESSLKSTWRRMTDDTDPFKNNKSLAAQISFTITSSFISYNKKMKKNKKQLTDDVSNEYLTNCQSALQAIRSIARAECDSGIANAVKKIMKKGKNDQQADIALLLSSISPSFHEIKNVQDCHTSDLNTLLPPLIALEHPKSTIRIRAIQNLVLQSNSDTNNQFKSMSNNEDSLYNAFMRRFCVEEDIKVALALSKALKEIIDKDTSIQNIPNGKDALKSLYKWTIVGKDGKKGKTKYTSDYISLTCFSLYLCGFAANTKRRESAINDSLHQGIISHLNCFDLTDAMKTDVETSAATALLRSLSMSHEISVIESAKTQLAQHKLCLRMLQQCLITPLIFHKMKYGKDIHDAIKSRCLLVTMDALTQSLEKGIQNSNDFAKDSTESIMTALFAILKNAPEKKTQLQVLLKSISACLKACFDISFTSTSLDVKRKIQFLIVEIASIKSTNIYNTIGADAVKQLLSYIVDPTCSFISILMEGCLRPSTGTVAMRRLCTLLTEMMKSNELPVTTLMHGIIPSLSLLHDSDPKTRESALDLLAQFVINATNSPNHLEDLTELSNLCRLASEKDVSWSFRRDIIMDGGSAFPRLLRKAIEDSNSPAILRKALLNQCYLIATATSSTTDEEKKQWLPLGEAIGGCYASHLILSTMEAMDNSIFPLQERWEFAGKGICESFFSMKDEQDVQKSDMIEIPSTIQFLFQSIVRMLKGVVIDINALEASDASNIVIMSSPSKIGGRRRSYSINATEGATYINPYPKDMSTFIENVLHDSSVFNIYQEYFKAQTIELVINSSWGNVVFPKLTKITQRTISSALLILRSKGYEPAGAALFNLPLSHDDFLNVWKQIQSAKNGSSQPTNNLVLLTFLADCIHEKTNTISKSRDGTWKLISMLFEQLNTLSTIKKKDATNMRDELDDGAYDYTCFCLLRTLISLYEGIKDGDGKSVTMKAKALKSNINLLTALIGSGNSHVLPNGDIIMPLISDKARTASLNLLTHLCAQAPSKVVHSLLPAMMSTISASSPGRQTRCAGKALSAVVPAFCTYANAAELSIIHLLSTFISSCNVRAGFSDDQIIDLYGCMLEALSSVNAKEGPSSFVSCYLANVAFSHCVSPENNINHEHEKKIKMSEVDLSVNLLQKSKPPNQLGAFLQILQNISYFITILSRHDEDFELEAKNGIGVMEEKNEYISLIVTELDLITLCCYGSSLNEGEPLKSIPKGSMTITNVDTLKNEQRSIMWLTTTLLSLVRRGMKNPSIEKVVKNSEGLDTNVYLYLWQQLMQIQTESSRVLRDASTIGKDFWKAIHLASQDTMEILQRILPLHQFLACTTALLKEAEINHEFCKRALLLLSDRASAVKDPAEILLYLETVPDLVDLIRHNEQSDSYDRRNTITQQTALMAIEHIAQSLPPNPIFQIANRMRSVCIPALEVVLNVITESCNKISKPELEDKEQNQSFNILDGQLFGSAVICAGTLISILKQRCVPLLPGLLKPILQCFSHVNEMKKKRFPDQESIKKATDENDNIYLTLKLLQRSILHTFSAVLDTLPNFFSPYLKTILSPSHLPSSSLRRSDHGEPDSVEILADEILSDMASKIPIRSLVPNLCDSIQKNFAEDDENEFKEIETLLKMLTESIKQASRLQLSPMINVVVGALTVIYDRTITGGPAQSNLITTTSECVLSLVMKISEAQLRPLYARLREWKGELDEGDDHTKLSVARRYAFWKMSATLSMQLKGIFLPCFSSVVLDAVKELEFAVAKLVDSSKSSKRRKLDPDHKYEDIMDLNMLRPLQPVLQCIENALKADAYEGGNWIRADDNQRYNLILSPLSKLLQAKIPSNFPLEYAMTGNKVEDYSTYEVLVQGKVDIEVNSGNISSTICALAAAAGNDQLWKPLNHAIIDACGHEGRAEVRKAGVSCLLSVLQLLGEEYMVLLPECLPILSELLEESNEEIASLARECIRLGEELLGESLEDSLR